MGIMCDPVRGTNRSAALYIQKLLTAIGELWPVAVVCDQPGCYLGGIVCLRLWVGKANQKKPGFIVVPLCILLLSVTKSCPTLCSPMDCKACQLLCPWDFPGKNTGVGCHFLLQQIFLTQGSHPHLLPCLLHCSQILDC